MTDQELSNLGIKGLIAAIKKKGGKPGSAPSSKPKLIDLLKALLKMLTFLRNILTIFSM